MSEHLADTNVRNIEYIRREDAINVVSEACFELRGAFGRCEDALKALPPADVAPVRHGRWIDMGDHGDWQWETDGRGNCWHLWKCNRCDGKVKIKSDFCPNCGAKLDKE